MRVVISQSMLFPWVGLLEQVQLADVFVHYDDVQISNGRSFVNRVQVKTDQGSSWMTIPLRDRRAGQLIDEVRIEPTSKWKRQHLDLLRRSFAASSYKQDALGLAEEVFEAEHETLGGLARASVLALVRYFGLGQGTRFLHSNELRIAGGGSERILSIVRKLQGQIYITGHGASRYLDHERFEMDGVQVEYMRYQCLRYPQAHGAFTPYVTGLDLVAHCGRDGARFICSKTVPWRNFLNESK